MKLALNSMKLHIFKIHFSGVQIVEYKRTKQY